MKKILSLILSFTIAMLCFNVNVPHSYADTHAMLSIADVTGEAGETVDVEIEISNNPGIIAISFDVEYDSSKLKLVKAEDEKLLGTSTSVFGKDLSANPYRLCWDDLSDSNNEQNGVLATLTFEILEDATGVADIGLVLNQGSTFNIDFEDVEFGVSGGKVVVSETVTTTFFTTTTTAKPTTTTTEKPNTTTTTTSTTAAKTTTTAVVNNPTTNAMLSIADVTGNAGDTVDVEVEISNNPGIIALSFDVEYDASKLKLVKAEDKKILGTSTSVFGKDLSANPYRLCWDDLSDSNNKQNGVLATLTFEILEDAAGEAEISLILNQGSTFNIDFEDVEFVVSGGKVNIGTESETPATDAMLSIADVSGEAGDTVDVEVEISNNPGIIAISFDVEYDSSKLKLVKAEDKKILGTSTSVFGKDLSANPYRLCWDDLSDKNNEQNGVLATLTFEILEDATGAADIDLILNQGSTFNIDFEDVDFAVAGGKVNIGESATSTTDITTTTDKLTTTTKTTTTTEKPTTTTTIVTTTTTTTPTTMVTTTTTPPTTELTYMLGDVNADGSVDSSDASRVLAEYAKIQTGGAGEFTDIQYKAADVNNDGVVDSSDASKILAYYAMVSTGKEPTWD